MRALVILICFYLLSCKNSVEKSSIVDTSTKGDSDSEKFNPLDSLSGFLSISLYKDTFEYTEFFNEARPYKFIYFKSGYIFNTKIKHAVALYSINDTTVLCELFSKISERWEKASRSDTLKISEFSPAFFNTYFDDYNFDEINDFKVGFYSSMGQSYSYGYILTFDPKSNTLLLHLNTIKIPNIELNKKEKIIYSTQYSNPNTDDKRFEIVNCYKWFGDTLKLVSQKKIMSK